MYIVNIINIITSWDPDSAYDMFCQAVHVCKCEIIQNLHTCFQEWSFILAFYL